MKLFSANTIANKPAPYWIFMEGEAKMMKGLMLTLGSLGLSASVVANAYYQKKQFYPSVVYITKSNPVWR